jgi:hypothetical protein
MYSTVILYSVDIPLPKFQKMQPIPRLAKNAKFIFSLYASKMGEGGWRLVQWSSPEPAGTSRQLHRNQPEMVPTYRQPATERNM